MPHNIPMYRILYYDVYTIPQPRTAGEACIISQNSLLLRGFFFFSSFIWLLLSLLLLRLLWLLLLPYTQHTMPLPLNTDYRFSICLLHYDYFLCGPQRDWRNSLPFASSHRNSSLSLSLSCACGSRKCLCSS